jgi:hypothetical protein
MVTMKLSDEERTVLVALAEGSILKSHRYFDGTKVYKLHPLDGGGADIIDDETVQSLEEQQLIDSNKKFPAAAYLLTEKGRELAESVTGRAVTSLGATSFVS